ncbi:NUDIX domain-containing protein [Sinosporangium siamense]|uniref:DNA mismatch repair protein MutT n=1 Tax=Sinosporangium siamense TaxID=1367973 RepID=A0A919VBN1_9ACTN|nr:NUDIX domain-containing protein [Sinosporangium siamense]GII96692.1 DNA mismatch repair protein MutT [Sinosporangium siamense]
MTGRPGFDYIGVGVGAVVFDAEGRVFMARRGPTSRNEKGAWDFPGGMVEFGEPLERAITREIREEHGMHIELTYTLGTFDHFLPHREHWVSVTYCAKHVGGEPQIMEPKKCTGIGWFALGELPNRITEISRKNVEELMRQQAR